MSRPDVRDRQTDVRQKHRLMPPHYGGGGIISDTATEYRGKTKELMYRAADLLSKNAT